MEGELGGLRLDGSEGGGGLIAGESSDACGQPIVMLWLIGDARVRVVSGTRGIGDGGGGRGGRVRVSIGGRAVGGDRLREVIRVV